MRVQDCVTFMASQSPYRMLSGLRRNAKGEGDTAPRRRNFDPPAAWPLEPARSDYAPVFAPQDGPRAYHGPRRLIAPPKPEKGPGRTTIRKQPPLWEWTLRDWAERFNMRHHGFR